MQQQDGLRELLLKTYTATSNEDRKAAEDALQKLQSEQSISYQLAEIILSEQREDIRTSAATYLVKLTRDLALRQSSTDQQLKAACDVLLQILQLDIGNQYKLRIATGLQFLMDRLGKALRHQLTDYLLKALQEQLSASRIEPSKCQQTTLVAKIVIVNSRDDMAAVQNINMLVGQFVLLAEKFLQWNQTETPDGLLKRLITLKGIMNVFKTTLRTIRFDRGPELIKLLYQNRFEALVESVLMIKLPNEPMENDGLFSVLESKEATVLTCIKENAAAIFEAALRIVFKLVLYVTQSIMKPAMQSINPFVCKIESYLNLFIHGLTLLLKRCKPSQIKKEEVRELMETLLRTVDSLIAHPGSLDYFVKVREALYLSVINPLLEIDSEDRQNFRENPTEFLESIIFTVNGGRYPAEKEENNNDVTIRALAARMLGSLCRYQDGFVHGLFQSSINRLMQPGCPDKSILLLQMAIAEINILERPDMLISVKKYLEVEISALLQSQQPEQTPDKEMEAFFVYFLIYRYTKSIDSVDNTFAATFSAEVAVRVLNGTIQPCNESCQVLSLEILSRVSQTNSLAVYQMSPEVVRILTNRLAHPFHSNKILDHLSQIIAENCDILAMKPESILECIRVLVNKIKTTVSQDNPNQVLVNKCWNCIRTIIDLPTFKMLIGDAQKEVAPLVGYIVNEGPNSFDEDIVLFTSACIRRAGTVSADQLAIFEKFPRLFEKNKFRFLQLFECINLYLRYGAAAINSSQPAIKMLLEMSLKALFVQSPKLVNESDNCEGALLLQNLILTCCNSFPREYWVSILDNMAKRLKMKPLRHAFLTANIVVVIAMCLASSIHLLQPERAQNYIELVLNHLNFFIEQYPSKVYVMALTDILRKYADPTVGKYFVHILDCLVTLLRVSYGRNLVDEDIKPIDNETKSADEHEHDISMSMFTCRLRELDQYELFKVAFASIRAQQPDKLQAAVAELIPDKQKYLKTLLGLTKIEGNNYRTILHVKRPT